MTVTTERIDLMALLDVASLRGTSSPKMSPISIRPATALWRVSFEDALKQALGPNARNRPAAVVPEVITGAGGIERDDGNNVDIDLEMARLQKNALYFKVYSQILTSLACLHRWTITRREWRYHDIRRTSRLRQYQRLRHGCGAPAHGGDRQQLYRLRAWPWQRQQQEVVFETVLRNYMGGNESGPGSFGGVRVASVQDDQSELPRIHDRAI